MENKVYPCLWFNGKAYDEADFYCSIFPNSKILNKTLFLALFELDRNKFMGMNVNPDYQFNETVSFLVNCGDQKEAKHTIYKQ